jgi:hypothetical protein
MPLLTFRPEPRRSEQRGGMGHMQGGRVVRVFISSPGDVERERRAAAAVVRRLDREFNRFFAVEPYLREQEPQLASGHFQDYIEPPAEFDVVVLILWSRLGARLPERTRVREYRGIDGRAPVTGTEWEYEHALSRAEETGAPALLVFRNQAPAPIRTSDLTLQTLQLEQLKALNEFWARHFHDRGVFLTAFTNYVGPESSRTSSRASSGKCSTICDARVGPTRRNLRSPGWGARSVVSMPTNFSTRRSSMAATRLDRFHERSMRKLEPLQCQ